MRYFFVTISIFATLIAPLYGDELQTARDALHERDYETAIDALLGYLERSPGNTELVERVISLIVSDGIEQRTRIERLLDRIENSPENLDAVNRAAVAAQRASAPFGYDVIIELDAVERVSKAAQEYRQLDAAIDRIGRHVRGGRFVAASEVVPDALAIGRERFTATTSGQTRTPVLSLAAEAERINDRFRTLYGQQPFRGANDARGLLNGRDAPVAERVADITRQGNEILLGASQLDALSSDLRQVALRLQPLQDDRQRIPYIEILMRMTDAGYYTEYSLPAVIDSALERQVGVLLDIYEDEFEQYFQIVRADIDDSRALVYGSQGASAAQGDAATLAQRYPSRAIARLDSHSNTVTDVLQELSTFESLLVAVEPAEDSDVNLRFNALLVSVVDIDNVLRSLRANAQNNVAEAARLRADGDRIRLQTEAALSQNEGRRASRLWSQARARYFDALALEDDEQFRQEVEAVSATIQQRILALEHAEIVREVRVLINRSRRALSIQDIDGAYSLIEDAAALWAITNVDANPEITRQQEFIEVVLTFEQIYNLNINDPLYIVLSGYLNTASTNIDSIARLVNADRAGEAEQLMQETERVIEGVVDVQPFNIEARTLNLRLIEVTDSEQFKQIVQELFDSAVRLADREPRQSLSDFYTIRELRPNFAGLERQIAELETQLGLRIPPPDPVNQQQVNQLLVQARGLIATGERNRIAAAEELLQQALAINPADSAAQSELDRLRINNGSSARANLSLNDEQLLRRAETLFVQGNIAQTFVIVENLWRAAENRNYTPLITLRRQVSARLGI